MNRFAITFLIVIAPLLAISLACLGLATIGTNPLGWFLVLTGITYAAGIVIVVVVKRRSFWQSQKNTAVLQQERGDRSFWFITLAMMTVFYLSPLEYLLSDGWIPRTGMIKSVGLGLVIAGGLLFVWARRTLGGNYSGHIMVDKQQQLVRSGPYRFIRHPAYAGFLLIALGLGLGYSSLSGLISVLILLFPSLVYRIKVEERLLLQRFGDAYCIYTRQVKHLIPWLW